MITTTKTQNSNQRILLSKFSSVRRKVFYLMLLLMFFGSTLSWGQILTDDFSYTAGTLLTANGWTAHSGGGTNAITVTTPGLTYPGHPGSGVGNAVSMTTSGEDVNKAFTAITSGSVYTSFLVNVTAAQNTGDYFAGLYFNTSTFPVRIYIKATTGGFFFGINKSSFATITYETTVRPFGNYLLVADYVYNAGNSTDDLVNLWVNPALGGTEGSPTISNNGGGTTADVSSIGAFYLRQGAAGNASTQRVDAIRVGTTWASVTPTSIPNLSVSGNTDHGSHCVGTPGSFIQYTINNTGGAANGVTVTSSDAQFAVSDTPATIPANGSATFKVIFTPSGSGGQSSTITVASATAGSNSPTIGLTGNGTASVAPVVSSVAASGITSTAATLNGDVGTLGVCPPTTEKGFVYSETASNNDPLIGGSGVTKQAVAGIVTGTFSQPLLALAPSTGYSYKAYVYDNTTYTYGTLTAFTTDAPSASVITITGTLSAVNTTYGTASFPTTSFSVSASGLTADILIVAPPGFEMSDGGAYNDSLLLLQTGGTVNSTNIDVRIASTTVVGTYSGNILFTSAGSNNPVLATAPSTVSPKILTIDNPIAIDKVYNGNTNATISGTLNGLVNGDTVTLVGTGVFASPDVNVGPPIAVISNSTLIGPNAANYTLTQPIGLSANITPASQSINFDPLVPKTFGNAPFNLSATASSGLMVSFSSSDTLVAKVSGITVTIVGGGTTIITASQAGNNNYFAAIDSQQTLIVNQSTQAITFPAIPNKTLDSEPFLLTATANSGLIVSYISSDTTVATVSGSTVTIHGIGVTTITASQSGNTNYLAAPIVNRTLTVTYPIVAAWDFTGAGNQTTDTATAFNNNLNSAIILITRGAGATSSAGSNSFRTVGFQNNGIAVTNTDYFQVTLQASAGKAISLASIDANMAGTASYAVTPGVSSQFAYSLNGTNFIFIDTPRVTIGTPATLPQINLTGISALQEVASGTTITLRYYASGQTSTGGWGFISSTPGINGLAIAGLVQPLLPPSINSNLSASGTVGSVFNYHITALHSPSSYNATGLPSGLVVDTLSGTITGIPTTVGTGSYNVSITATNFSGSDTKTLVITIGMGNQTINFGPLTPKTYGDAPFNLTAIASSGLTVSYVSSDTSVATISGNIVTILAVGTTDITASQIGNSDYNPASNVIQTLTINKANQTITFGQLTDKLTTDPPFVLGATASSGLTISYQSSDPLVATVSNDTVTIVGPGTTTITASQGGNNSYNAATNVLQNQLVIDPNAPFLTATPLAEFGDVCINTTAGPNTFTINGANLNTDSIVVEPFAGYGFSVNDTTYSDSLIIHQGGGSFTQLIYVKFNPTAVLPYEGNIVVVGGGLSAIYVAVLGNGINSLASVTTGNATNVTQLTATLNASIPDTGCTVLSGYGIEYSLINGFVNGAGSQVAGNNFSGGSFSVNIGSLIPATIYYYKAYAFNGIDTSYGTQQNFTTLSVGAPVAIAATNIDSIGFTANWNAVNGATSYELDVSTSSTFFNPQNTVIAGWTFPVSGSNIIADTANANNTTQTLTSNGTISTSTGVTTQAATVVGEWLNGANTKYWQIIVNTAGYYNLRLSSAQRSSATGPRDFKVQYKVGAGAFTDLPGGTVTVANDFFSGVLNNLALPASCDNQDTVTIRWIMTTNVSTNGATVAAGTSRIDNIFVSSAIPLFLAGYNSLTVSDTAQAIAGLNANTAYFYRVRAVSINGTTGNSNTIAAHTCTSALLTTSFTLPSCNGNGSDGSATVVASGGTLPYAYLWSNSQTNDTAIGLSNGTYMVTVTSNTGCPVTDTVEIPLIPLPLPSVTPGAVTVCQGSPFFQYVEDLSGPYSNSNGGYPAGTLVEWILDGTPLPSNQWLPPTTGVSTSGISDFQAIVHLPSNIGGCIGTSASVHVNTHQFDNTATITDAACGNSNGKINVVVTGTGPFTYSWSTGRVITGTSATTDSITGLMGGVDYTLVVTDANCNSGVLTYHVNNLAGPSASISAVTDVHCAGGNDGSATVSQTGGFGAITYEWFPYGGNAATSTDLGAGPYYVVVTDENGCYDTAFVTINQPDSLLVTGHSSTNASCGGADGVVTVSLQGGTVPYSYAWYDEVFNEILVNNDTVTGLIAGTYLVFISDSSGCPAQDTVTILENCNATLNLTAFIEGYYLPGGSLQPVLYTVDTLAVQAPDACDTIRVELHNASSPIDTAATASAILHTDGTATLIYPGSILGGWYYIAVFNRGTVETWSHDSVHFVNAVTAYNFTTGSLQAYDDGINPPMKQVEPGKWAFYSGDIDKDGTVAGSDANYVDNDASAFAFGYNASDLNGDGASDGQDANFIDNNSQLFLFTAHP